MRNIWLSLLFSIFASCAIIIMVTPTAQADPDEPDGVVIIGAGSPWRKHYTFFAPRLATADAEAAGVADDAESRESYLRLNEQRRGKAHRLYNHDIATPPPPADWMIPGFDDADWLRLPGADFTGEHSQYERGGSSYVQWFWETRDMQGIGREKLRDLRVQDAFVSELGSISMRAALMVDDPALVERLTLDLTYRGGFVAYLNGEEIARGHMPDGDISFDTAADTYPAEMHTALEDADKLGQRERRFGPVEIDRRLLRPGRNVIALSLHRSDFPAQSRQTGFHFAPIGLAEFLLRAETAPGNVAGSVTPPDRTLVRTAPSWERVREADPADPSDTNPELRITSTRNGRFAGWIIVNSPGAIEGLSVSVDDLTNAAGETIPADNIEIRYGAINPTRAEPQLNWGSGLFERRFDSLLENAPDSIETAAPETLPPLRESLGLPADPPVRAVAPVWLTFNIPAGAEPGEYSGVARISVANIQQIEVPIRIEVSPWRVPELGDQASKLFIYQSPDTLAAHYEVEPWSDEHWALIERSLSLIGASGNGGLMFSLLAETQMGNAESIVRWVRRPEGGWDFDFTLFDRYLDTAMRHHHPNRIHAVVLNVWGEQADVRRNGRPGTGAVVTVIDPDTGQTERMKLPEYGSLECEDMLRPLLHAVMERLDKRGLADHALIGTTPDATPNPAHVAMFRNILPETSWYRVAHIMATGFPYDLRDPDKRVPVGVISLIARHGAVPNPAESRHYGWRETDGTIRLLFNRGGSAWVMGGFPEPNVFRWWMESSLVSGYPGAGHIGADYFKIAEIPEDWPTPYHPTGTFFNKYPTSDIELLPITGSTPDLLAPGQDGPVTTVRLENSREGFQLAEARIIIERALLDEDNPLPDELSKRCRILLDERLTSIRTRRLNMLSHWGALFRDQAEFGATGWRERDRRLFGLAAEVMEITAARERR